MSAWHRLILPCDLSAPRLARTWVSKLVNPLGLDEMSFQNVLLAVSEIVTNAVVHAETAPTISLRVGPDEICIEVQDSSERPAEVREFDDRPGGWGLRIVEQVAERWGPVYKDTGDKAVCVRS